MTTYAEIKQAVRDAEARDPVFSVIYVAPGDEDRARAILPTGQAIIADTRVPLGSWYAVAAPTTKP